MSVLHLLYEQAYSALLLDSNATIAVGIFLRAYHMHSLFEFQVFSVLI